VIDGFVEGFRSPKKPLDGRDTLAHTPLNPSQIRTPGMYVAESKRLTHQGTTKAAVESIGMSWK
jgi:hypothetical protein